MIRAYIRVSTVDQSVENQKNEIFRYAQKNKMMIDEFLEVEISSRKNRKERKINMRLNKQKDHQIIQLLNTDASIRSISKILEQPYQIVYSYI